MAKIKITATSPFFTLDHTADTDEEANQVVEYIKARHDEDFKRVMSQLPGALKSAQFPDLRDTPDNLIARQIGPKLVKTLNAIEDFKNKFHKMPEIPPEAIILRVTIEKIKDNAV